jgi:hypothetical protein
VHSARKLAPEPSGVRGLVNKKYPCVEFEIEVDGKLIRATYREDPDGTLTVCWEGGCETTQRGSVGAVELANLMLGPMVRKGRSP